MQGSDDPVIVDLHSNVIEDDAGTPTYRLVALVSAAPSELDPQSLEARVREKDTQLRELQHRVKSNLQMITALIRMETRNAAAADQTGLSDWRGGWLLWRCCTTRSPCPSMRRKSISGCISAKSQPR